MANIDIGGRLHSTATGNVVAGANEILDDSKGKKQSTINAEVETALEGKQDEIADLSTIRSGAAAGATAYQKPGTGIPSSDMASGVQTSLGKADSAYQKPSGGIPKTDLESGVQDSLELADTAVQAEYIGSITPSVNPGEYAKGGTTAQRPTLTSGDIGFTYYDSTLSKTIVWNGSAWVNMDGTALA